MTEKNIDAVLSLLKNHGSATSNELAKQLNMTSMGARQHLLRLAKRQLVSSFTKKMHVGRPRQYWQLTSQGHARFPDSHADLTVQLIDSIKTVYGVVGLEKLISSREHTLLNEYQQLLVSKTNLKDKVYALAEQRSKEGYMAEIEQQSEHCFLLVENHCPICSAAKQCQSFCRSELEMFQQALGKNISVERIEHLFSQERRCVYRIEQL